MDREEKDLGWGDDTNYKSCFARSVVVNSQHKHIKSESQRQLHTDEKESFEEPFKVSTAGPVTTPVIDSIGGEVKLRKKTPINNDFRRLSCSSISSSRRSSICSNRISEIPVENIAQQSRVSTLQWQLKEIEKSREMYKAVMKQVVTFLEKAHRSLEMLGNKLNTKSSVHRSKSEHQIVSEENAVDRLSTPEDYSHFRDFTWRRPGKEQITFEVIPPEKLSQEAFRLLRTAQSLLSTQEPKLTAIENHPDDIEFLAQLAREFPQTSEIKPQRATSFSLSPKLLTPDKEIKISTAFNRKLSLQLNETRKETSRFSHYRISSPKSTAMDSSLLRAKLNDRTSTDSTATKIKLTCDKSTSPPAGSISSVEDESGFSSMNSFPDVGLPILGDEVNTKNALLRSMLHNNTEPVLGTESSEKCSVIDSDFLLWQKPDVSQKRWSSTPVKCSSTDQTLNVLWV